MKKVGILILALLVGILATGCSSGKSNTAKDNGNKPIVMRFAHEEIPGSVQDLYVQKFKEILEKKTNGRVQVKIYPIGQLGDATQQCELLQNGGIEAAIVSPGNTGTIVPENQLFSLHFLFSNDMKVNKAVLNNSKALYDDLGKLYLDKNIKVLDYWTEGFMNWTSDRPLQHPADFKGFKMRTMPSPMIVAAYQAYGANPTPVPYMEVYSGLQLHQIQGEENPMFAIQEMKFYEVQKYLTLSNHDLYVTTTAVNPQWFDSLPKDIQQDILDTVNQLKDDSFQIQQKLNDERLDDIKKVSKINIETLTPEERAEFKRASTPARDQYIKTVGPKGKEILEKLEQEIATAEKNAK